MTTEEFLKLQIGMFITDHQDVTDPSNYCLITKFEKGKIQLQPMKSYGQPANAHPFWESFKDINLTEKLHGSEYYSLSREFGSL